MRSTGRKVAFGFASLLAPANEVRCVTCGERFKRGLGRMNLGQRAWQVVDGVGAWVGAHRRWLWAMVIAAPAVIAWKLYLFD